MNEETSIVAKDPASDSNMFGVSVRAWLAFLLVFTVCSNHLSITVGVLVDALITRDWGKVGTFSTVGEPLYSMAVAALGFYFGQKTQK